MRAFRPTVTVGRGTADVERMGAWMIGVLVVWALVALGVAVVPGRGIRLADARSGAPRRFTTADLPAGFGPRIGTERR